MRRAITNILCYDGSVFATFDSVACVIGGLVFKLKKVLSKLHGR